MFGENSRDKFEKVKKEILDDVVYKVSTFLIKGMVSKINCDIRFTKGMVDYCNTLTKDSVIMSTSGKEREVPYSALETEDHFQILDYLEDLENTDMVSFNILTIGKDNDKSYRIKVKLPKDKHITLFSSRNYNEAYNFFNFLVDKFRFSLVHEGLIKLNEEINGNDTYEVHMLAINVPEPEVVISVETKLIKENGIMKFQTTKTIELNDEDITALKTVRDGGGYYKFSGGQDYGHNIKIHICDKLVSCGLLEYDDEAYHLTYDITDEGEALLEQL